jgi:hypothetical protein
MHIIDNPFYIIFFVLPPILLIYQKRGLNHSPISPMLLFTFVGWVCIVFGSMYHYDRLSEYIRSTPNPPEDVVRELTSDSEIMISYPFGWVFSVIYFSIWKIFIR